MTPDKQTLRAAGAAARAIVADNERLRFDAGIVMRVMALPRVQAAACVCCYMSMGKEAGTVPLIDALLAAGKRVSLPVVDEQGRMIAAQLRSRRDLVPGRWGIPVPARIEPETEALEVVICPGVLFTRDGARLGRGQGHYDRFLVDHADALIVGLGYEAQLVDALPTEPHDVAMDVVVTEVGVYGG